MFRAAEMCCYQLLEAFVFDIVTMSIQTDVKRVLPNEEGSANEMKIKIEPDGGVVH